jgi:hypothetical protein
VNLFLCQINTNNFYLFFLFFFFIFFILILLAIHFFYFFYFIFFYLYSILLFTYLLLIYYTNIINTNNVIRLIIIHSISKKTVIFHIHQPHFQTNYQNKSFFSEYLLILESTNRFYNLNATEARNNSI